jgi:hypothetical protein
MLSGGREACTEDLSKNKETLLPGWLLQRSESRFDLNKKLWYVPPWNAKTTRVALQDFHADHDVYKYLHSELSVVRMLRNMPSSWPSEKELWQLAQKSEGIFFYASTLVKFIGDEHKNPQTQLQIAFNAHSGVDSLFEQVLQHAKHYANFVEVLGTVMLLRDTLPLSALPQFLSLNSVYDIRVALGMLVRPSGGRRQ